MSVVLDTSAILAIILGESGGEMVAAELHQAATSTVMIAEVYSYAARNDHPLEAYDAFLQSSRIEIVPLGNAEAVFAGTLAAKTKSAGLSLGDRCCLTLAKSRAAEVLTADRAWAQFAELLGISVRLIR
jgi:PIN domain nuclease of toxin-antitoxin system